MQRRKFIFAGSAILGTSTLGLTSTVSAETKNTPTSQEILPGNTSMMSRFDVEIQDVLFVFADLHPGLIKTSKTIPAESLEENVGGLAKVSRAIKAPALFLTVPQNGQPGELVNSLRDYANSGNTIFRKIADPFLVTDISEAIRRSGRKTLIVAGYTAEVVVLLTSLGSLREGYKVFIPVDCIGSKSPRTEEAVLQQAEQAGAVITSLSTLAAQLAPDFSQEPGTTILSVIAGVKG